MGRTILEINLLRRRKEQQNAADALQDPTAADARPCGLAEYLKYEEPN
jgi:hypothetical protein